MLSIPLHREYPELKVKREQIDAIDRGIAALLKERSEIVRSVGQLKRSRGETSNFIRADREALMLRRITESFEDEAFSPRAAAAIWRIIIGASTSMEAPLKLVLAHADGLIAARDHFGPSLPCDVLGAEACLEQMRRDPHAIGIFPLTAEGLEAGWWKRLPASGAKIFACLPYVRFAAADHTIPSSPVFAAAAIEPADSGAERSLFLFESAGAPVDPEIKILCRDESSFLLEAEGFCPPESDRFQALASRLAKSERGDGALKYLGNYAIPYDVRR